MTNPIFQLKIIFPKIQVSPHYITQQEKKSPLRKRKKRAEIFDSHDFYKMNAGVFRNFWSYADALSVVSRPSPRVSRVP